MRALVSVVVVVVLSVLAGCSTLSVQERMTGFTAAALRACKEDGRRCAAAKLCGHAAADAAQAIQSAREATATGRDDAEASLRAASLPVAADAQCSALGFKPIARSRSVATATTPAAPSPSSGAAVPALTWLAAFFAGLIEAIKKARARRAAADLEPGKAATDEARRNVEEIDRLAEAAEGATPGAEGLP